MLKAEFAKPLDERDLKRVLAAYEKIEVAEDDPLKPYVAYRIRYIKDALAKVAQRLDVQEMIENIRSEQQEYAVKRARLATGEDGERPVTAYAAQGVLLPSRIYAGRDAAAPKRYMVIDPRTQKVTAYVQDVDGNADLASHARKHVGVHGSTTFVKELMLDVVEAETVVVLSEDVQMPAPPKPLVRAAPAPTPATKPAPQADEPDDAPEETTVTTPTTRPAETTTQPAVTTPATQPSMITPAGDADNEDDNVKPADLPNVVTEATTQSSAAGDDGEPDFGADGDDLPETGLPVADATTRPADTETVDREEYK
jgi:hypothetical protein